MDGARKANPILLAVIVLLTAGPSAAQIAPADEQAIRQLVSRLYEARVQKDIAALSALFAPNAPRTASAPRLPTVKLEPDVLRELIKPIERMAFPYERLELTRFTISNLKQQATSMTGIVTAEVAITATPGEKPRAERWIRNMGFMQQGDTWLIWREASAGEDLAVEISRATTPEERDALLEANPALFSEELALALASQGDRFSTLGNTSGAVAMYELALRVGEQAQSVYAVALVHLKIGQASQLRTGPKPDAIAHFKTALDGFTALGDRAHIVNAEIGLATCYYMQDDQAAREHYQKAIEILETFPDKLSLASALHSYGNACYMVGDFGASLEAYRRSMDVQEAAGSRTGIPSLWRAIGHVQKDQRDYDAAIESYGKALAGADNDYATQSGATSGLADVYRLQGRFELSLEQYGRALALTRAHADDQGSMQVEADIGNVYMSAQQPAAALDHYQKSLALAQQIKNQSGVARSLAGSGAAYFAEMEYDLALDAYNKALAIQQTMGPQARADIAWLHAHIGMVLSAVDRHEDALASFQSALDLSNQLNDAAAIAVVLTLQAAEQVELEHPDQGLELATKAAALARDIEGDDTLARAKTVIARVLKSKGDREGAARALQEAMAAVASGRARAGDESPEDFFGDTRTPFKAMAVLAAEDGKTADALVFAERAHLALLLDILAGNRSLISAGLSDAEQEEEQQLARVQKSLRVQVLKEQGRPKSDAERLASLKSRLADADRQRAAFSERIYATHPSLKLQRGFFDAATAERLTGVVPDGQTAVLEFVTTDKQTLVFVLTRKTVPEGTRTSASEGNAAAGDLQIDVKLIDVRFLDLTRQVREFRRLIRGRDEGVAKAARELYDLLLQPVQEALAGKRSVVIVPDGPLWSLPFQALQSGSGRYLIRQCAVSYAPSLTVLDLLSGSSLAPVQTAPRLRVVAVANQLPGSATERLKLLNAAADVSAMPNAVQEAAGLTRIYGPKRTKIYAAADATQTAVQADAQAAGALHFATFFVPSVGSPMHSPIVFAGKKTGEANVGEAWQLMKTQLPPITIVSRVQVDRVAGDGTVPVGLSWMVFVAGSRHAVLATWPDDSPGAVSLMLGLHRALAAPGSAPTTVGKALRQAILPLLATKYRHPFYWANFAVIGIG